MNPKDDGRFDPGPGGLTDPEGKEQTGLRIDAVCREGHSRGRMLEKDTARVAVDRHPLKAHVLSSWGIEPDRIQVIYEMMLALHLFPPRTAA
jgi:hypothetical protein